jgi:sarcosine/dimethylglycine N-methyltransferase
MTSTSHQVVETAREYYNSEDADNFYFHIWGGEDIHVGVYFSPEDSIRNASRRTVERMAARISTDLNPAAHVLDIGAGYGGAARYLARTYGCKVTALNLSEVENGRNRTLNEEQGVSDLIDVLDGSFEEIPLPDASVDVVWSQDAILHSGNREQVLQEVHRVLKPGGEFVFTDPMMADDCPEDVLQPILDRIHLSSLGSPEFYRKASEEIGLRQILFEDLTHQLVRHYERVLQETVAHEGELEDSVGADYIGNMKKGLAHWIEGGKKGHLAWGIFNFRKPQEA